MGATVGHDPPPVHLPPVDFTNSRGDETANMKSPVIKRSVVIGGHKTSVTLEDAFWRSLKEIAAGRRITLSALVAGIDTERQHGNLSSAIRLFVLDHYQVRTSGAETAKDTAHPR